MATSLYTERTILTQALAANSTASDFPALASSATEPTGSGVHGAFGNALVVVPYGTDAADETFDLKVVGWSRVVVGGIVEWVPTEIIVVTVTLGTASGAAGGVIGDSALWADAIAGGDTPKGDTDRQIPTVTANTIAWFQVNTRGVEKVQFLFKNTTSASANCLFRFI